MKELFATWDVASILGVSQQTVRNLIGKGELVAIRIGSTKLFVKRDSLNGFLKRRRTVPRSVVTSVM
jgi:excisionase family DNA binding protein